MLWFRIFMAVMMLLIPATMLGFGYYWKKNPPDKINCAYGYRTRRSTATRKAWAYAHVVCARAWRRLGLWTLVVTLVVIALIFLLRLDVETTGTIGGTVVILQLVSMLAVIPVTERALKQEFGI